MKGVYNANQSQYRKNSYRENIKNSAYNSREEQKPSYSFIQQTKLRIVQKNLVSVSGLGMEYSDPDLLGDTKHFGKYGTVNKIIISTQGKHRNAFIQVYITYEKPCDAAFAIKSMDGITIQGKQITATFGTTKYCTYFLKQNQCRNQKCFYLHNYDTKNQLMDGVKNNMDFLDQKSQTIIIQNLKHYLAMQIVQKLRKQQESEFPTIGQTIEYLIEQGILNREMVQKIRKQLIQEKKEKPQMSKQVKSIPKQVKSIPKQISKQVKSIPKQISKQVKSLPKQQPKQNKKLQINHNSSSSSQSSHNKQQLCVSPVKNPKLKAQNKPESSSEQEDQIQEASNGSNRSEVTVQKSDNSEQFAELAQRVNESQINNNKNKKCHSLSTNASPTKYEKNVQVVEQTIDKTIQKRLIKQIMRNNMVFRSRMDFVPANNLTMSSCAKQQNNKMKNYVKKHLLNEI